MYLWVPMQEEIVIKGILVWYRGIEMETGKKSIVRLRIIN